jgi:hypothetical protein
MKRDLTITTLREACMVRGINPDATGYKPPRQRLLAIDRIIPSIADRIAPTEVLRQRGDINPSRARRMYTRQSAANDAGQIADGGTVAYVAAFCRLNNLTEERS